MMDFSLDADFSGSKSSWSSRLSSSFISSQSNTTGVGSWKTSPTGGSTWTTSPEGGSSWTTSPSGGSSWCQNLLSRTFGTGGYQDQTPGGQRSRERSQSITLDFASASIQIPSFARRGSLQPQMIVANGGGSFITSSLTAAAGGGSNGEGQPKENWRQSNDNVEKECKQVFFDCAL